MILATVSCAPYAICERPDGFKDIPEGFTLGEVIPSTVPRALCSHFFLSKSAICLKVSLASTARRLNAISLIDDVVTPFVPLGAQPIPNLDRITATISEPFFGRAKPPYSI